MQAEPIYDADLVVRPPAPPERAERLALPVLMAGACAVVLAASTWKPFELDRYFVPKELVLHVTALTAGLLMRRSLRRMAFTRIDLALAGYLALGVLSTLFATNVWLAIRALAISASGILLFQAARALRERGRARPLLAGLVVAVLLGALGSLLQTYGVHSTLFSIDRAPGGTLGNRNSVAHMAAFGLPVVLLLALRARRWPGYLAGALAATVMLAVLVLTRSRAAWLASAAAVFVFGAAFLVARTLRGDRRTLRRCAGIAAVAVAGVSAALLLPNALRWSSESPYLESVVGVANYREGSGRGRVIEYDRSLRMALRYPLLGVGPGNWPVVYPKHAARGDPSLAGSDPGTTANPWPSSDWVAFVSERGFAAALLLAAALGISALHALRSLRRAATPDQALEATTLLALLAAVTVAGAFDAVLLLALPATLVWIALGALWPGEDARPVVLPARLRGALLAGMLVLAGVGVLRSTTQLIAIGIYSTRTNTVALSTAARIDPGNYRVRLRLAQSARLKAAARCRHARAAHRQFPSASAARAAEARCR